MRARTAFWVMSCPQDAPTSFRVTWLGDTPAMFASASVTRVTLALSVVAFASADTRTVRRPV